MLLNQQNVRCTTNNYRWLFMIKIFETGDNHIGKKFDRYPEIKDNLIQSRFDSLEKLVQQAEKEKCDFLVFTGDLFDNVNAIKRHDVKVVVDVLSRFSGRVLILPGNHDYYTGEEKLWIDFRKEMDLVEHNIILLTEMKEYKFEVGEEKVVFYPAFCQSKHSKENNLAWIKNSDFIQDEKYRIGIAHGAIQGITPDINEEYYLMTETELNSIPVDAWLIGHTHIPYPNLLNTEEKGYKIFNAGTHEQTDLHNNTTGFCFVISIDYINGHKVTSAHSYNSGNIGFYDIEVTVEPTSKENLSTVIKRVVEGIGANSVIRLRIQGTVEQNEYENKNEIYKELLKEFMTYEIVDIDLSTLITAEKIKAEFPEISFAANLLNELMDDPKETQMAYNLLNECRE